MDLLTPSTLALATVGEDLAPHVASVYFVTDDRFNLYFFSDPLSQHGLDLVHTPQAAVAIYPEAYGWQEIRGLQMRGEARPVAARVVWEAAWERYAAKFPFVMELQQVVAQNQLYEFIPDWMRLVDNARGFGYKAEWVRRKDSGEAEDPGSAWQAIDPGAPVTGGEGG